MSQWEKQVFFCENEKNVVFLKLYINKIIIPVHFQMTGVYKNIIMYRFFQIFEECDWLTIEKGKKT